jgi:hypothetical protein
VINTKDQRQSIASSSPQAQQLTFTPTITNVPYPMRPINVSTIMSMTKQSSCYYYNESIRMYEHAILKIGAWS